MKFTPGCKTALIVLLKYHLNLLCHQKEQEIILLGKSNMFFLFVNFLFSYLICYNLIESQKLKIDSLEYSTWSYLWNPTKIDEKEKMCIQAWVEIWTWVH